MTRMTCLACGGELWLDIRTDVVVCTHCDCRQSLNMALSDHNEIINLSNVSPQVLSHYKQALRIVATAKRSADYAMAADILERLPGFWNADSLSAECRQKESVLRIEEKYNGAVADMNSQQPYRIQQAAEAFEELGSYRDAPILLSQCPQLMKEAEAAQKKTQKENEKLLEKQARQIRKAEKRRIRRRRIRILLILIVIVGLTIGFFVLHSKQNLHISMEPDQENYIENKRNHVVFYYDVTVENTGYLDIIGFDASVIFENTDGEVLVDTKMYIDNYDSPAVRSKKTVTFTWELSVYSEDTAWELYGTDFEDLKVTIKINEIRFSTGLTRTY